MEVSVTLSANAGVALNIDGCRIWVDVLHDRKVSGFSTLTPELQREMMENPFFSHPDFVCFTHDHPDHYSAELTAVARQLWPNARLLMPGESVDGIRFIRLPHEGEQYLDVEHYGLIISKGGKNILIPGDCEVASPELTKAIEDLPVHMALLNFPWVSLRKGREYVLTHLENARLVIYHLPFEADDIGGYRQAARHAAEGLTDVRLLMEPLQTEIIMI